MGSIHVELTEESKRYIKGCLKKWEDVEDRDAEDWGIKAGLGWVMHKLNLHEYLYDDRVTAILIPDNIIEDCRKEWKENAVDALWNRGYSRAIFSVFKALGIGVETHKKPIEYLSDYYNK